MKLLIIIEAIVLSALLICLVFGANQFINVNIRSSGTIIALKRGGIKSQIRGVFIAQKSLTSPNFTVIADILANYGINLVTIEIIKNYETCYQSAYVPLTVYPAINFSQAIETFHTKGIEVYAHFDVMYRAYTGDGINRKCLYIPHGGTLRDLQEYNWLDIANPASQSLIRNLITELVTKYDIDGIVFDYTRWDDLRMPYTDYDKIAFISYTGLSNLTWPDDVVWIENGGTGKYVSQFLEWRVHIINEFAYGSIVCDVATTFTCD